MLKTAIIMNHNSYPGREYAATLLKHGITFDIISIGSFPNVTVTENARCGGLWQPMPFEELAKKVAVHAFPSLKDPNLVAFLESEKYDIGIQGGTGILRPEVFNKFRLGLLNFHPGDLPKFRGCSAPEWQVCEHKPVVSTCHLIDSGIDTGDIYKKKVLAVNNEDYHHMRASIYPETAKFVVEVVQEITQQNGFAGTLQKQNEADAMYRKYIGDEVINSLIEKYAEYK